MVTSKSSLENSVDSAAASVKDYMIPALDSWWWLICLDVLNRFIQDYVKCKMTVLVQHTLRMLWLQSSSPLSRRLRHLNEAHIFLQEWSCGNQVPGDTTRLEAGSFKLSLDEVPWHELTKHIACMMPVWICVRLCLRFYVSNSVWEFFTNCLGALKISPVSLLQQRPCVGLL